MLVYIFKSFVNLAKIENKYYNKEEMTREEKLLLLLAMDQLESYF